MPEPPTARRSSLRVTLIVTTALVTFLAVLVSGTFVALTGRLHQASQMAASSAESVYAGEEAEVALLLHVRTTDPAARRDLETTLLHQIHEAHKYVGDAREARLLRDVETSAADYLAAAGAGVSSNEIDRRLQKAHRTLESLVDFNIDQSRTAKAAANRWDRVGEILGPVTAALLIVVAVGMLIWLRRRAFQPLLALAATMDRFGRGDRTARASYAGAAELITMSNRFNEMAAALAAQREAGTAFLAGVAHDLRNPLGTLKLAIDLLGPAKPLPAEPSVRKTIGMIDRQIVRLDRMVGDFLDMAKIEAGELELKCEEQDANHLVRQTAELFIGYPSLCLNMSLPSEPVPLFCDSLRIEQVITNLVSNAIKYSPVGAPVDISVAVQGGEAVLEVSDHGIGISVPDIRLIFEPFRRVGSSKDTVPGVGLGLFMVRRILSAHGGRIEVDSTPERGSTFRVSLPLHRSSVVTSPRRPSELVAPIR